MVDESKEPAARRLGEKILIPVAVGVVLAGLGVAWNWGTQGGVVRLLGGITKAELDTRLTTLEGKVLTGIGPAIPRNAVLAFAGNTGCVAPWKEASFLGGKFVLGKGGGFNLNDKGGQTSVMLAVNQMPSHQHDTVLSSAHESQYPFGRGGVLKDSLFGGSGVPNESASRTSAVPEAGTQAPLDLMPPYYVLEYCILDPT